jgi:hypothetical protein
MSHNCDKCMDLIIIAFMLLHLSVLYIVGWGGDLNSARNFYRPQVCIIEA